MKFWPIAAAVALGFVLFSGRKQGEIEGLERLQYPVLFQDDEGCCHLLDSGDQFLQIWELQDLDGWGGWDSLGRRFHVRYQPHFARVEVGAVDHKALEQALSGFLVRAERFEGWVSPEACEELNNWFASCSYSARTVRPD